MADNKINTVKGDAGTDSGGYEMDRKKGAIFMLISATGMGCVGLLSRWATRTDMFDATLGLNGSDSIGAVMAMGRMFTGFIFFLILLLVTHKQQVFKNLKLTPAIALGGLSIGMSLSCYVTSTLMTTIANAVMFIYTGPVICVLLARIFRKEPMSALQWVCLAVVFVGMMFGEGLLGFGVGGQSFGIDFNLTPSTPEFPQKLIGDIFGLLSGLFYGLNMFFNGYRKDADTTARGVWNFAFATLGALIVTVLMNIAGVMTGQQNWITELHFTAFNWVGAVLLWIICGPLALGTLLVAGRNLPAADYSTIAYWEVPVALFIGLFVFGEAVTLNTGIGVVMILAGGCIPTIKSMIAGTRHNREVEIREQLSEKLDGKLQPAADAGADFATQKGNDAALLGTKHGVALGAMAYDTKVTSQLAHVATSTHFEPAKTAEELQAEFAKRGLPGYQAKLDIPERTEDHVQIMALDDLLNFAKDANAGAVTYDVTYFPHADATEVNYQLAQMGQELGIDPEVLRSVCASEIQEYLKMDAQRDVSVPVHSIVEAYIGGTAFAWYGINKYSRLRKVVAQTLLAGGDDAKRDFIMRASRAQVDLLGDPEPSDSVGMR